MARPRLQFVLVLAAVFAAAAAIVAFAFVVPEIRDRQARDNVLQKLNEIDDALKRFEAKHPNGDH